LLTGIGYRVERTATETSNKYAGSGFRSSTTKSPNGVYQYQFTRAGTYNYWSGCVDDGCNIKMRGTITVTDDESEAAELSVKVNGFEATYSPGSRRRKRSVCTAVSGSKTGCTDPTPSGSNANAITYSYYTCATPEITAISPTNGTSNTVKIEYRIEKKGNEILV
jgi:hypothetical protein